MTNRFTTVDPKGRVPFAYFHENVDPAYAGGKCSACGLDGLVMPAAASPHCLERYRPSEVMPNCLWCPACGDFWTERNGWNVARAWWAWGAQEHDQHHLQQRHNAVASARHAAQQAVEAAATWERRYNELRLGRVTP